MGKWIFVCVVAALCAESAALAASNRTAADRNGTRASAAVTSVTRTTSIYGTAWKADNSPIANAHLRLRNVVTGKIEATTTANEIGRFMFSGVEGGTYVVELVSENGKILTVGQVFAINAGETVATFVRLGTHVPWFTSFFSNAAAAAATAAAAQGVTAIAPVAPPASHNR